MQENVGNSDCVRADKFVARDSVRAHLLAEGHLQELVERTVSFYPLDTHAKIGPSDQPAGRRVNIST